MKIRILATFFLFLMTLVGCGMQSHSSTMLNLADEGGDLNPQPLPPIAPEIVS